MNMKKIVALALVAMMLLATAACGNAPASSAPAASGSASGSDAAASGSSTPAPAPAAGLHPGTAAADSVVINLGSEPPELNTIQTTDSTSGDVLRHTVERLTKLDQKDLPIPGMAESWTISDDALTYTFKLRQNATWTNGEPVTAKDFVFAWTQVITKSVAAQYSYFLTDTIKGAKDFYDGKAKIEDVGFKAVDDYTLEVVLTHPIPYFLSQLSFYTFAPVNEKAYTSVGADKYNKEVDAFFANGAYTITEWVHEDKIVLTKRDDYYDAANIAIKTIDMRMIKDSNTAMNAFQTGEIDMIGLLGTQRDMINAEGYPINNYNDGGSWYFEFNTANKTLSNAKIRQALTMAIDVNSYIKNVLKNDSLAAQSLTSPVVAGHDGKPFADAVGTLFTRDAAAAKKLLDEGMAEAGVTLDDLNKLTYITDDSDNATRDAAFFQNQWKTALGFEVQVQSMTFQNRLDRMTNKDFDIVMAGWSPDYNDPMTFMDLWVTGGGNNHTGYANPAYDKLIKDAAVEVDVAKRQQMFIDAEKILAADMPVGLIYYRVRDYLTSEKLVGIVRSPFQNICLLYAKIQ